jgi:hypothetical protein
VADLISALRPPYPVYDSTPIFGGDLPTIDEDGPPDVRPSAMNPAYSVYAGTWGRNFAGLGDTKKMQMQTGSADEGIADYPNELNVLAEADDVNGNGVFDPHGSPGNQYPDEGIFADSESMPGYVMRDQFYAQSEVIDGTTGYPVMYVPGGAVPIDEGQWDTDAARQLMYELQPGISPQSFGTPGFEDNWIPEDYSMPVAGLGETPEPSRVGIFMSFAVVGVAVGLVVATLRKH